MTGSVVGVVRDPTGAVVPGAYVRATNTGTSANFQATSNSEGQYAIRTIPIGEYKIEVEASGFKKYETTGIRLQVDEIARVDIPLTVGAATRKRHGIGRGRQRGYRERHAEDTWWTSAGSQIFR